ncbi:MAG: hypothetical protein DRP45_03250 [Candidatus Zixiibacteriota bacterium]|nr:MAG: hypothetical protein DRP45_03250 [candidate division Zixibacteria bacterium]
MDVRKLRLDDIPEDVKLRLNGATFLGSTGFARLWQTMNGRNVYWALEDGGNIRAVLTGVEFGRWPLVRFQSMPDGCYARAVMIDDSLDPKQSANILSRAIAKAGYAKVYIHDFHGLLESVSGFEVTDCATSLVDVTGTDWQPPDKKLQSEIRKAQREEITVQRFEAQKHMDRFVSLMESTEQRHGRRPKYPRVFYESLAELAETDERVVWVVVEHKDALAASHIYFIENDVLLNWQIYFDKAFSFLKPNQFIMHSTVIRMVEKGVKTLNLGATPGDAESLETYKQKWGGRTHSYRCFQKRSWLGRLK